MDYRVRNAQFLGRGHFLDAVGMEIGEKQVLQILTRMLPTQDLVDNRQEFVVFLEGQEKAIGGMMKKLGFLK